MGRPLKNGRYINANIAADVYEILEKHCQKSGQTKTVAIERAIKQCYGNNDTKSEGGSENGSCDE